MRQSTVPTAVRQSDRAYAALFQHTNSSAVELCVPKPFAHTWCVCAGRSVASAGPYINRPSLGLRGTVKSSAARANIRLCRAKGQRTSLSWSTRLPPTKRRWSGSQSAAWHHPILARPRNCRGLLARGALPCLLACWYGGRPAHDGTSSFSNSSGSAVCGISWMSPSRWK